MALLLRCGFHALALAMCLIAFVVVVLGGLAREIADEVRASRQSKTGAGRGETMLKNRKVRDFDSTKLLRAMNAELAARHGDDSRARAELAEAAFYADNAALPIRRPSC